MSSNQDGLQKTTGNVPTHLAPVEHARKPVDAGMPKSEEKLNAVITKAELKRLLEKVAKQQGQLDDIEQTMKTERWLLGDFVEMKPIKKILAR